MYESSAKCNTNLAESTQELLEESDSEIDNEETTCMFIKDAILGHIDEHGFVITDSNGGNNPFQQMWDAVTGGTQPAYVPEAMEQSNAVTGAQAFALTLGAIGTASMAAAAYYLHQQVESQAPEGLMASEDPSTPSKSRPID